MHRAEQLVLFYFHKPVKLHINCCENWKMQKLTFTLVSFDNTQVYSRKSSTPRSSFCQFFRWDGWRLQLVLVRDLKPHRCARAIFLQYIDWSQVCKIGNNRKQRRIGKERLKWVEIFNSFANGLHKGTFVSVYNEGNAGLTSILV